MEQVAVLGLGNMGLGIARNLQEKGFAPVGIDLSDERCKLFEQSGGKAEQDLSVRIAEIDILVVCLISDKQIASVFTIARLAEMKQGAIIIVTSTVPVAFIEQFAQRCAPYKIEVLDSPISGGQAGAEQGILSIFAAGPEAALLRADPVLSAVSKKIYHLGSRAGLGSKYKIAHQLIAGIHIVAAAEAVALARKSGLDLDIFYDIVNNSGGQSWLFGDRAPRMIAQDYQPKSDVNIFIKDLTQALDLAEHSGVKPLLGEKSLEQFQKAAAAGYAAQDDSSVVELY